MRIEDVIVRYLPAGGQVLDRRPEPQRGRMSFAATAAIEVGQDAAAGSGALVVTTGEDLDGERVTDRGVTLVTVGGKGDDGPVPDVLAWAGDQDAQVVEITRLLAPPVTAVVVRHDSVPEVPAVPGRAEPIPATDATWRRLCGELLFERHRAAVREAELDRVRGEVAKLRRSLRRAQEQPADTLRRRLRLPRLRRSPGGDSA